MMLFAGIGRLGLANTHRRAAGPPPYLCVPKPQSETIFTVGRGPEARAFASASAALKPRDSRGLRSDGRPVSISPNRRDLLQLLPRRRHGR